MIVIPYNLLIHHNYIEQLLNSQQMDINLINTLPKFGLIAIQDETPIAIGAIREIEGNMAMLDSYLTNSTQSKELRNKALDLITAKLIKIAIYNKVKRLLAFSLENTIVKRSIKHGFIQMPYEVTIYPV